MLVLPLSILNGYTFSTIFGILQGDWSMDVPIVVMGMLRMTELADYLRRVMKEKRWTRQDAADRTGVSKTAITNIVNKKQQPELETLASISAGFDIPLTRLIELCGYELPPLKATRLTDEEERILSSLTPMQRDAVLEVARQMLAQRTQVSAEPDAK